MVARFVTPKVGNAARITDFRSKETQGRGAPVWGSAFGRAFVFCIFPNVFDFFFRLSHNYQHLWARRCLLLRILEKRIKTLMAS